MRSGLEKGQYLAIAMLPHSASPLIGNYNHQGSSPFSFALLSSKMKSNWGGSVGSLMLSIRPNLRSPQIFLPHMSSRLLSPAIVNNTHQKFCRSSRHAALSKYWHCGILQVHARGHHFSAYQGMSNSSATLSPPLSSPRAGFLLSAVYFRLLKCTSPILSSKMPHMWN